MYPVEIVLLASIPILIWISIFAFGYVQSRRGRYRIGVNILAILGALLAFVSLSTGWGVSRTGYDWSIESPFALFLLFTYPLAVITPLAGIGQMGVLLWVLSYSLDDGGTITPYYGYVIAWISVVCMFASIVWPIMLSRERTGLTISDKLLTLTIRRTAGSWISPERAVAVLFTIGFLVFGTVYLVWHRQATPLALVSVGLFFVWFMVLVLPAGGIASRALRRRNAKTARVADAEAGNVAWLLFVGTSFVAILIAISTAIHALSPHGSGEQNARTMVEGVMALAVVVPLALYSHRRAIVPSIPKRTMVISVTLFGSFMLMASIQSYGVIYTRISVVEWLILAGIGLIGPALLSVRPAHKNAQSG